MKNFFIAIIAFSCALMSASAANINKIPVPNNLKQGHPRLYITESEKSGLQHTIASEQWAKDVLKGIHERIDEHVLRHVSDPTWMPSRLQMHWKTMSTDIYIRGIYYSHSSGKAPVPTVRFAGSRDNTTDFARPELKDILPYMDDERGLYLPNKTKEGKPFEWIQQSKTGTIIPEINNEILGLARDAAFIYWLEGDARYAQFAFDIFNTYMSGMYYRGEPIDLDNGHVQTLVGFTCFQTIHEGALKVVSEAYDFLYQYIEKQHEDKIANYETTIKKWNDIIIKNGVPQNNWNLHQANIILKAAMVLEDDQKYADKKGRQHYIDYMLNVTSPRQWSLTKLIDYGYDENNGVWGECPSYSQGVTKELMAFITDYYNAFDSNILPYLPVMQKAVTMMPQYQFPNGHTVGFGDSHYGPITTEAIANMIRIAQKSGDKELEAKFTSMYKLFNTNNDSSTSEFKPKPYVSSFFASKPLEINNSYPTGKLEDYITQTFYAPNVSWHAQRIGTGKNGLMASVNGSLGNHMHANGINIELYGKGIVQGADPGKGANYLQPKFLEYYSQFPAHNTVMVDGVSSYPEMLSNHAFTLNAEYPKSEKKEGFDTNVTYSDVYFIEPETQSDQTRTVSIVKTGETTGYYVDIFRSKRKNNQDKFHDYYYHNLGQTMQIMDAQRNLLPLKEEEKVGFAGGHLFALDYMWGEKFIKTNKDYQVEWKIDYPNNEEDIFMNLWMKGSENREIISILSPSCKSHEDTFPYNVAEDPYLTFIARQHGEAWNHPFISIYEPYTSTEGRNIASINSFEDENGNKSFAGVEVNHKSGQKDIILSCEDNSSAKHQDIETNATYTLISNISKDKFRLFMGNGSSLKAHGFTISSKKAGNIVLNIEGDKLTLHNEVPVTISYKGKTKEFGVGDLRSISL